MRATVLHQNRTRVQIDLRTVCIFYALFRALIGRGVACRRLTGMGIGYWNLPYTEMGEDSPQ